MRSNKLRLETNYRDKIRERQSRTIWLFVQSLITTKGSGKGTGLGLSTVIGIVKNHDGFVNLQSEIGKGSQFQVCLPAIDTKTTQSNSVSQ